MLAISQIHAVTIDYYLLITALLLLWFPRQWLRAGRKATKRLRWLRRSRNRTKDPTQIREPGDTRLKFSEEFTKPRNYIDFLRALAGGLVVIGAPDWGVRSCIELAPDQVLAGGEDGLIMALRMTILLVAMLVQFVRYEKKITFYASTFFLAGMGFALCGFSAGFVAFLIVWTMNTAMPLTPAGFLSAFALLIFMLGLLFLGVDDEYVLFAGIVCFLPVMISLLARRSLALFNKRMK